jgi:hypothetical protein
VVTVRVAPVSAFLIVTVAPPTAAPDASSTLPEMFAVTCAHAGSELRAKTMIAKANCTIPKTVFIKMAPMPFAGQCTGKN